MSSSVGLRDWLIQRVSAVLLGIYFVCIMVQILQNPHMSYEEWSAWFKTPFIQTGTFVALVSLSLHAWIGIWTVATDYLKSTVIRLTFLGIVVTLLISFFAWGLFILWG